MGMSYVKIHFDMKRTLDMLSDAEVGRLLRAILEYGESGQDNPPQGREGLIYSMLREQVDRDRASYQTRVDNGSKGGRPKTENNRTEPNETENNRTEPNLTENNQDKRKTRQEKDKTRQEEDGVYAPTPDEVEAVIRIPTHKKSVTFPITQADIDHWSELYPAVDIMQELRKMVGWCESNPERCKVNIRQFVNNWLSKQQDRGGASRTTAPRKVDPANNYTQRDYTTMTGVGSDGLTPAQRELLAEMEDT